jgi:archaellum biogenesis ATPase FlaH
VWFVIQMKDSAVPLAVTAQYVDEFLHVAGELGSARNVTEQELRAALAWAYGKARRDPLPAARRALDDQRLKPEEAEEKQNQSATIPVADADSAWMTAEEAYESAGATGPRFDLGFPAMDKSLEGGIYAGTITTCQGKPGIGKTMYLTQAALHMAETCAVACLFADEGVRGALITLGQQMGVPRNDLIARDPAAIKSAIDALNDKRPFFRLIKPSHPRAAIESFFEDFFRLAPPGMQRVALIDSGQRVRLKDTKNREGQFEAIGRRFETIRDISVNNSVISLVVSQVNRGQYRKQDDLDDPLAGGYGSAAIEFASELLLNLDGNPTKAAPRVRLRAVKNRISAEGTFEIPLMMDYPRKAFIEIDPIAVEGEIDAEKLKKNRHIDDEIDKLLQAWPDGLMTGTIKTRIKGRATDVILALSRMVDDGKLCMDELPRGGQKWKRSLGR